MRKLLKRLALIRFMVLSEEIPCINDLPIGQFAISHLIAIYIFFGERLATNTDTILTRWIGHSDQSVILGWRGACCDENSKEHRQCDVNDFFHHFPGT